MDGDTLACSVDDGGTSSSADQGNRGSADHNGFVVRAPGDLNNVARRSIVHRSLDGLITAAGANGIHAKRIRGHGPSQARQEEATCERRPKTDMEPIHKVSPSKYKNAWNEDGVGPRMLRPESQSTGFRVSGRIARAIPE
jgi:hypothetical protein